MELIRLKCLHSVGPWSTTTKETTQFTCGRTALLQSDALIFLLKKKKPHLSLKTDTSCREHITQRPDRPFFLRHNYLQLM